MKRTVIFKDAAKNKVVFDAEITERNGYPEFTASGEYCGGAGQCFGHVEPDGDNQKKLIEIWRKWHLNGMHAGTEKQEEHLKNCGYDLNDYVDHGHKSHYDFSCHVLKVAGLLIDDGYKYGSAWLARPLPEDFEDNLNSLMDDIEQEEEDKKDRKVNEDDSDLFESFSDPETAHALALMFDLSVNEIDDIIEEGDNRYTVQGVEYIAGDDDTMKEALIEEVKYSAWAFNASFLADFCDLPQEVFEALQPQCENANDAIIALIEKTGTLEDFAEAAESADGRGHFLNRWNGGEDSVILSGVEYYAYRQ